MATKRQLLLELLASDKTGPATKGAAENLDLVAESAEEAAKATDHLGHQAEESTEGVERFGRSNRSAAEHAEALKHEIENVEHELHQLAVDFAEAQTAADRADFSKAIRRTQSDLRQLNRSKNLVEDLIPGADPAPVQEAAKNIDELKRHISGLKAAFLAAGTSEGRSFLSKAIKDAEGELGDLTKFAGEVAPSIGSKIAAGFSSIGPVAVPVLAGIAVAAAPAIGATISGAIIGAVGLGGVVGGFALAARDPRVKSAASAMKTDIGNELKDAASPFVDTSIKGIHELGGAVKGINFKQIFADSSKNAIPIIDGATNAVEDLGGAIENIIHHSGPVVTELGHDIASFSGTLAGGLNSLADNGQQGAEAMHQLFIAVDATVDATFRLVNGLTETYGALSKVTNGGPTHLLDVWAISSANVAGKTRGIADAIVTDGIPATSNYGSVLDTTTGSLTGFTDALDAAAAAGQDLYGSTTNVAQALADADTAIKQNGKTLDANTQKGRNNRRALDNVAQALIGNVDAYVKVHGAGSDAVDLAGNARGKFIKLAEALGRSKTQAEALATQLGLLPRDVYVDVHERIDSSGHRIGGYRADGGPVKKGHAYVVGEKRAEVFVPDRDGTIIPSINDSPAGTYSASAGSAASGGGGAIVVNLVVDGKVLATQMVDPMRNIVRNKHGGSVQRALGFGAV